MGCSTPQILRWALDPQGLLAQGPKGPQCRRPGTQPLGPKGLQATEETSHQIISAQGAHGVLAGPGTPRDPKSHLFATKWVAIPPFGTLKPGSSTEFRPGSRRGGPGAQIPTFFSSFLDPQMPKSRFSWRVFNLSATHRNGFGAQGVPRALPGGLGGGAPPPAPPSTPLDMLSRCILVA